MPAECSLETLNKGYLIEKDDKSGGSKSLGNVSGYNCFWLVEKGPGILHVLLNKMSWFLPENFTATCFRGLCMGRRGRIITFIIIQNIKLLFEGSQTLISTPS